MKLSPHFYLSEFTTSQVATRQGINNEPSVKVIDNLSRLAHRLEKVRAITGPIIITSGYRSPLLNQAVGGSQNSQHMEGLAADFICPRYEVETVFNKILEAVHYDQVINEFGRWIHFSIAQDRASERNESLIATNTNGITNYKAA